MISNISHSKPQSFLNAAVASKSAAPALCGNHIG
jgi:hypothetical protein